jgi:hypothetical protein
MGNLIRCLAQLQVGDPRAIPNYMTQAKPDGSKFHIPCADVDEQISEWLQGIVVDPELVPKIRETYRVHIEQVRDDDRRAKMAEINLRLRKLREEEVHLGRLVVTGKISEETFDRLQTEWQEKILHVQTQLADLEREAKVYLDELDAAIALMPFMYRLFERIKMKESTILLQILVKRIIVDRQGEIVNYELNSPFAYLRSLVDRFQNQDLTPRGLGHVHIHPPLFR